MRQCRVTLLLRTRRTQRNGQRRRLGGGRGGRFRIVIVCRGTRGLTWKRSAERAKCSHAYFYSASPQ